MPDSIAQPPEQAMAGGDRDVVAGFPVRRFVAILIYSNMMFIGGLFFLSMLEPLESAVDYSDDPREFFERVGMGLEIAWDLVVEILVDEPRVMLALPIPGTLGGIAWYLIGRWRESRLLKKRRQALAEQNSAVAGPADSANPPLQ